MVIRRSISFPTDVDTQVRVLQAQAMLKENRDISFNDMITRLLRKAMNDASSH